MPDLAAFLIAVGPLALLITKTVDTVRNILPQSLPKVVWNLLAFGFGVGYCLLFAINLAGLIAFQEGVSNKLTGTWGQVVTGLAIGATASFWHEHLDATSQKAKALAASGSSVV
jgi:hypothetical protein